MYIVISVKAGVPVPIFFVYKNIADAVVVFKFIGKVEIILYVVTVNNNGIKGAAFTKHSIVILSKVDLRVHIFPFASVLLLYSIISALGGP